MKDQKTSKCSLDTNCLVALVIDERPKERKEVERIIKSKTCFISNIVIIELEYVLRKMYGFSREDVAHSIRGIICLTNVECEKGLIFIVLRDYEDYNALSFSDVLIAHTSKTAGFSPLYTYDKKLYGKLSHLAKLP